MEEMIMILCLGSPRSSFGLNLVYFLLKKKMVG